MASRTKQKEQARAQRLAEEQARQAAERRQRRVRMLGGVILAAVAVVAVAIAISASGGSSGTNGLQTGAKSTKLVSQVTSLLVRHPPVRGDPRQPQGPGHHDLLRRPRMPGLPAVHPQRRIPAARGQRCPRRQGQGGLSRASRPPRRALRPSRPSRSRRSPRASRTTSGTTPSCSIASRARRAAATSPTSYLNGLAHQVPGLNFSAWSAARNDSALSSQVLSDDHPAQTAGVQGTPTLVFKGPKGQAVAPTGVPSYSDLQSAIKQVS